MGGWRSTFSANFMFLPLTTLQNIHALVVSPYPLNWAGSYYVRILVPRPAWSQTVSKLKTKGKQNNERCTWNSKPVPYNPCTWNSKQVPYNPCRNWAFVARPPPWFRTPIETKQRCAWCKCHAPFILLHANTFNRVLSPAQELWLRKKHQSAAQCIKPRALATNESTTRTIPKRKSATQRCPTRRSQRTLLRSESLSMKPTQ